MTTDLFSDAATQEKTDEPGFSGATSPLPLGGSSRGEAPAVAAADHCCGNCDHAGVASSGFVHCDMQPRWSRMAASWRGCYFEPVRWVQQDPARQARRAAQDGIDQAVAAAERSAPGWSTEAFAFIRKFAEQQRGKRYIGHEIVQASIAAGVAQPQNEKAWGGPIQRAARAKVITRVGYAEDPNRHGNPVPLWETT